MSGADWVAVAVLLGAVAVVITSAVCAQIVVEWWHDRDDVEDAERDEYMREVRRQP